MLPLDQEVRSLSPRSDQEDHLGQYHPRTHKYTCIFITFDKLLQTWDCIHDSVVVLRKLWAAPDRIKCQFLNNVALNITLSSENDHKCQEIVMLDSLPFHDTIMLLLKLHHGDNVK